LPAELAAQSHDWVNCFFGQEGEREPHTVGRMVVILPETLASSGVFLPGEMVYLTKAQIAKLPSNEPAKPLPTPAEMEASVTLNTQPLPVTQGSAGSDTFPVSGFP